MRKENKIKNALLSVSNKSDICTLARNLTMRNVNIFSTGGTSKILKQSGITVTEISNYTKFPEIMNGRVKTLHPKIYAGILARQNIDNNVMKHYGIIKMDMVVVNFYPFWNIVNNKKLTIENIIEYIDIGGPTMVRSSAKNYKHTAIIVNISDYQSIISEMDKNNNEITLKTKFKLAVSAFDYVTKYDTIISNYFFNKNKKIKKNNLHKTLLPKKLELSFIKKQDLRYGENQHQKSAFYVENKILKNSTEKIKQIQGLLLSYNNILDANIAIECVKEFNQPTCVIVKHGNPCSVATKNTILEAYVEAYNKDPISSFGGVIAFNYTLDPETVKTIITQQFVEVIIAPDINENILKITEKKPKIRILIFDINDSNKNQLEYRSVQGGLLVQESNSNIDNINNWNIVTTRKPNKQEFNDSVFAWKIVKYIKSNAIVYTKNMATVSIGAGQMSRIYSAKIANIKAKDLQLNIKGAVMASDAFFPFRDGIDIAASVGITCIIQPGGSIRDKEIIEAANQNNIAMFFTNVRYFKH
ncbi:bifunctional phosphoribosylaminoimidazolecarboxamide formyltransferase/IMP cyclohydrolase [Buchnera aphidicola]|uniref:bifunctional phosphoribosylaminoimidazolecarboxamide formyltransferase/IMP cyclohydrolase n=1 Tax=Buchnera aphidicola TaxID=9 RepID=UPI003464C2CD